MNKSTIIISHFPLYLKLKHHLQEFVFYILHVSINIDFVMSLNSNGNQAISSNAAQPYAVEKVHSLTAFFASCTLITVCAHMALIPLSVFSAFTMTRARVWLCNFMVSSGVIFIQNYEINSVL